MRQDVRITQTQADQHYAELLAGIGGSPADPNRWVARRERRRRLRRRSPRSLWWKRPTFA